MPSKIKDIVRSLGTISNILEKCGGPGSGVPGPCPSNSSSSTSSGNSSSTGKGSSKPKKDEADEPKDATKPDKGRDKKEEDKKPDKAASPIAKEPTTDPPPGDSYKPNVDKIGADGITTHARVGVGAMDMPPPPALKPLPNLTKHERIVEKSFMDAFAKDPNGMATKFREVVTKTTKAGEPPTFGTDDVKALTTAWSHKFQEARAANRATLNTALHQVANAVAKRAFVQHLDTLKEGDEVMVTVGGCGAGKGFALKNVPEALAMKQKSKAVWDSAGDQNATENPWVQKEAEARGLKVNYCYVHAEPRSQWAHPERGVLKRAANPEDGRMVDAKVFADSYAIGAKNHQAFYEKHKDNPNASFVVLENSGKPKKIDSIPEDALNIDRKELAKFAIDVVKATDAPAHVKRGALIGTRIWGDD